MGEAMPLSVFSNDDGQYSASSGIFAYLNFFVGKKRLFILETLINGPPAAGIQRLRLCW